MQGEGGIAQRDVLVRAGIGDGGAVAGADDDQVGFAVEFAIADDQVDNIAAGFGGGEEGIGAVGKVQFGLVVG